MLFPSFSIMTCLDSRLHSKASGDVYKRQEAMLEGGVDAILIETIFDTLNAKAAIFAAEQAMKVTGVEVPVMLSLIHI